MKGQDMIRREEMKQIIESEIFKGFLSPQAAMLKSEIRQMGTYTGLAFKNPEMQTQAMPVFNLDAVYEKIKDSESTADAALKLADMVNDFVRRAPNPEINISEAMKIMSDYEKVKPRLYMEAVSYKYENPYVLMYEYLDMKFVPKILLSDSTSARYVMPATKEWAEEMGVTEEEVFAAAIENTPNILKPEIHAMSAIISEYAGAGHEDLKGLAGADLLVITDERKMNGASLILSDTALSRAAEIYKGNGYILPSSTHEIMAIPAEIFTDETSSLINSLSEMVAEVNDIIPDAEILSYNVYHYDAAEHKLEKATDYNINKQLDGIRELRSRELNETDRNEPDSTFKI